MKNNKNMFIPRESEIRDEWLTYFNRIAMERFGASYGYLEKTQETRSFLGAFTCIRDYIVKYNASFKELTDEDVVRIIWESHYAKDMKKMRPGRPFLHEQTRGIVIIASVLAEINRLLDTSVTIQDCGLGFTEQVICPHCKKPARLKDAINQKAGKSKQLYICDHCGAYCGTHAGTDIPLGLPGDEMERKYRQVAHLLFDTYWKNQGMTRDEAYAWLAGNIGVYIKDCHIGRFNVDKCKLIIKAIGLPSDLEISDYFNMIKTNTIPWADPALCSSPDKPTDENIVPAQAKEIISTKTQEPDDAQTVFADSCRKMEAVLGKRSIPDLVKYICNVLGAAHDLKSHLISFITEYHLMKINNEIEISSAPSIQDEIADVLKQ